MHVLIYSALDKHLVVMTMQNNIQSKLCIALFSLFLIVISGCTCEDEQMDIPIDFADPLVVEEVGVADIYIEVKFNKPIDTEFANSFDSVNLRPAGSDPGPNDFYQIEFWSQDQTSMFLEFSFGSCSFVFDCNWEIFLEGDDEEVAFRSLDGQFLDGNYDGTGGDDFFTVFEPEG